MFQIDSQYELTDYQRAQRLNSRSGTGRKLLIGLLYLIVGFQMVFMVAFFIPSREWAALVGLALLAALYLLVFYVYVPVRLKRDFHQQKEWLLPFHLEVDADGLRVKNDFGKGNHPWAGYARWREDEHLFLLYPQKGGFFILPKRLLAPAAVEFIRQRLLEHKIPQK